MPPKHPTPKKRKHENSATDTNRLPIIIQDDEPAAKRSKPKQIEPESKQTTERVIQKIKDEVIDEVFILQIVKSMSHENLTKVAIQLIEDIYPYVLSNDSYLDTIKCLIQRSDIELDNIALSKCFEAALYLYGDTEISSDNNNVTRFFASKIEQHDFNLIIKKRGASLSQKTLHYLRNINLVQLDLDAYDRESIRVILAIVKLTPEKQRALIELFAMTDNSLRTVWQNLESITMDTEILEKFLIVSKKFTSENQSKNKSNDQFFKKELKSLKKSKHTLYPIIKFNGNDLVQSIRKTLYYHKNLHSENKMVSTAIGHPLSLHHRFFPDRSPLSSISENEGERYIRSQYHPIRKFNKSAPFSSNITRGIHSPSTELDYKETSLKTRLKQASYSADMYDASIAYRLKICKDVSDECKDFKEINVGVFNDYPCVMVHIVTSPYLPSETQKKTRPADERDKWLTKQEGWVQLLISLFVGLTNFHAEKKGLPIELVRRSSFGFLTPTISCCGESFRLNLGIVPPEYSQVIVDSLIQFDSMLALLNKKSSALNWELPKTGFLSNQKNCNTQYNEYKGNKSSQSPASDLFIALHNGVTKDAKTIRTGAIKLTDNQTGRNLLAKEFYNRLIDEENESGPGPFTPDNCTNLFLDTVRWGFGQCVIIKEELTFKRPVFPKNLRTLRSDNSLSQDHKHGHVSPSFFSDIKKLINPIIDRYKNIKTAIDDLSVLNEDDQIINSLLTAIDQQKLKDFYFELERFNEMVFAKAASINTPPELVCGSDSEIEETTIIEKTPTKLYGNKTIVDNGMESINATIQAASDILKNTNKLKKEKEKERHTVNILIKAAYYEVNNKENTKKLNKNLRKNDIRMYKAKKESLAHIVLWDLNACVTDNKPTPPPELNQKKTTVWIIDSTSSSIKKHREYLDKFKHNKNVKMLFFVSSGIKNEQNASDKISYGTIRFFTKDPCTRTALIKLLRGQSEHATGLLHNFRRIMKNMGNVPTNKKILADEKPITMKKITDFFQPPVKLARTGPKIQKDINQDKKSSLQ